MSFRVDDLLPEDEDFSARLEEFSSLLLEDDDEEEDLLPLVVVRAGACVVEEEGVVGQVDLLKVSAPPAPPPAAYRLMFIHMLEVEVGELAATMVGGWSEPFAPL